MDIKDELKKLHSPEGQYTHWKDAVEDVLVFNRINTQALTDLAGKMGTAINSINARFDKQQKEIEYLKQVLQQNEK